MKGIGLAVSFRADEIQDRWGRLQSASLYRRTEKVQVPVQALLMEKSGW
jgi:hypothetical protein